MVPGAGSGPNVCPFDSSGWLRRHDVVVGGPGRPKGVWQIGKSAVKDQFSNAARFGRTSIQFRSYGKARREERIPEVLDVGEICSLLAEIKHLIQDNDIRRCNHRPGASDFSACENDRTTETTLSAACGSGWTTSLRSNRIS
jgi:hypothetical protein